MRAISLIGFLIVICSSQVLGQATWRTHLSFEFGFQFPVADMADRFGNNSRIGIGFELLNPETKWVIGIHTGYMFGVTVHEDVLAPLRTAEGDIIGRDRSPADVSMRERGFHAGLHLGRIIPFKEDYPLSGIKVLAGAGILQHKIRIQDNSTSVTQLTGDYKKGYDRLSNGLAFNLFAGYQHYDDVRNVHFLVGLDFNLAFTENRRSYNFDTMGVDNTKRTDGLVGIRIGWILPIGKGDAQEEIFY